MKHQLDELFAEIVRIWGKTMEFVAASALADPAQRRKCLQEFGRFLPEVIPMALA